MARSRRPPKYSIDGLDTLRPKERKFVLEYLSSMDARQAAEAVGYHPRYGYQLLQRPHLAQIIRDTLSEHVMDAIEALARLSDMARARIDYVISERPLLDSEGNQVRNADGSPAVEVYLDPAKAIRLGKGHLVKDVAQTHEGFRVKLHDAQKALVTILKVHRAFEKGVALQREEPFENFFEEDLLALERLN